LKFYDPGTWGPAKAQTLLGQSGRSWMDGVLTHAPQDASSEPVT
jgi:hypothetical protein